MSDGSWHLMVGGQPQGPFSLEQLKARVGRDFTAAALVWREGLAEWTAAGGVPELAALLQAAPARPAPAAARTSRPAANAARNAGDEEPTLNPFRLALRSFRWRGRFDRGQFAMVWFGVAFLNGLLLGLLFLAVILAARAIGGPRAAAGLLLAFWAIVVVDLIVAVLINVGALIRRLNDLGQPSWWVVGAFVPVVNLALIIYLLVAQGDPAAQLPASFSGAILALGGLFVLALLGGAGFFFAVMYPAISRARLAANEASAQGDLRAVVSAQVAYSFANSNLYESRWECLKKPETCIPGYRGPSFLHDSLGEETKSGYLRKLHTGGLAGDSRPAGSSPSSTGSFALVAWPVTPGKTGERSFCVDTSGSLCSARDASPDALVTREDGQVKCSSACQAY